MNIREEIGLKDAEEQLNDYESRENYERARGFDEQDEYLHSICSQQREVEKQIGQLEQEYNNEIKKTAQKVVKQVIERLEDYEIIDFLEEYSSQYTDNNEERDEIVDTGFDILHSIFYPPQTSIISLQYETKFTNMQLDDLILVNQTEYESNDAYCVDKIEILHFLIENTIINFKKVAENCTKITIADNSIFYIICPLDASEIIKKEYEEITNILY